MPKFLTEVMLSHRGTEAETKGQALTIAMAQLNEIETGPFEVTDITVYRLRVDDKGHETRDYES